jgi:pre-rRNA-processing protein TSR4
LYTAVSNTLWAEYEMIIENETEFSTEMVENNACTNSLISKEKTDDTMMSNINIEVFIVCAVVVKNNVYLLKSLACLFFHVCEQGDDDKKSWASFQECIAIAPEQVLR